MQGSVVGDYGDERPLPHEPQYTRLAAADCTNPGLIKRRGPRRQRVARSQRRQHLWPDKGSGTLSHGMLFINQTGRNVRL